MSLASLHYLCTETLSPVHNEPIQVECSFSVRDVGCHPSRRDVRAVIESVLDNTQSEILPLLDSDAIASLEREAMAQWQDEMECFNGRDHHE